MNAIVMKFGGSSVATVDKIKAIAALVKKKRDAGHRLCIVVSAMGKTTDALIAQAKEVAAQPARRELDMLLTVGERTSAALLTMALIELGVDAISFTGSQAGIVTNATHAGARVLEVRPYRVQDELEAGRVVVLAGFQGVSYAKEITTLGRGGSDTTAVAMAAALDASCEIYSDVDGVWTSDPRVVPDTKKLEALTYEEMQELAEAGAKVLNAQAVQFAKAKGIAIFAKMTPSLSVGPGGGAAVAQSGTVVRKDAPPPVGGVRGVAHRAVMHRLRATGIARLPRLLRFLDEHHLPSGQIIAVGDRVEILVPPEDAHGFARAVAQTRDLEDASFIDGDEAGNGDVGVVSLVGQGILQDRRVLAEALTLLSERGMAVEGVTTSSFRISFLLPPGPQVEEAARALHARFVVAQTAADVDAITPASSAARTTP
jgi:aspartate kinase